MATITLQIIAKDEIEHLRRILKDYSQYFDAVQIAVDNQEVIAQLYPNDYQNVEVFKYEWQDDFAHKRNWLREKCKTDYYFSIDTDDEILFPEQIRPVLGETDKAGFNIAYGYYLYGFDKDGNCHAAHWKERLIKNTPVLLWNKKIHENIIPQVKTGHTFCFDDRLAVKHLSNFESCLEKQKRNLGYLLEEYRQDKDKTDPRTIAYLGRVLFGMGDFKAARFFLEKHIELSGWDEDRHFSWCQLADLHRLQKNYDQALACAFEALAERPDYPDGYLAAHWIYFDQCQWKKAIEWGEQGLKKEQPQNFMLSDPASYTWRPAVSLSYCYFNLGEFEKAKKLFDYAAKLAPNADFIKANAQVYQEALDTKHYTDHLLWLIAYLKDKAPKAIHSLIESIPYALRRNRSISLTYNRYALPKKWGQRSIVIYCGDTPEPWTPKAIEKGIGGSEEAVIQLSRQFKALGYEVTVYNTCDEEGEHDGVHYLDANRFNPRDFFNIIIAWRCNVFNYGVQGANKIIWIHDVPNLEFTNENIRFFDKIVVLSKYHASLLPKIVPEEKIFISTNGLVPDDFKDIQGIPRVPHRIIYASSYDRGLEHILTNWQEIRKAVPDAEIHVFYGWNTYQAYLDAGILKDDGFRARMEKFFTQEGVYHGGRISHKALLEEYAKSSIFAYPGSYIGEINCIALTKAIACGCYPLTNDFAVLPERNTHGRIVKNEKFIPALIALLRHGDTKVDNEGYVEANSWRMVAEDWERELFFREPETIIFDRRLWIHDQLDFGKSLVDIGCNKGHVFDGVDRAKITSVDIDEYSLPNFVRADAQKLPFSDKYFDQAVLAEIVEHTKDPVKTLSEARRVAKRIVITVPYEYEWPDEFRPFNTLEKEEKRQGRPIAEFIKDENPAKDFYAEDGYAHMYHEVFYTPELLHDHLKQAGFLSFKMTKIRFGKWVWLGVVADA